MLGRAAERDGDVEARRDGTAGQPHLVLLREPAQVGHVARGGNRRPELRRERRDRRQRRRPADAASDAEHDVRRLEGRAGGVAERALLPHAHARRHRGHGEALHHGAPGRVRPCRAQDPRPHGRHLRPRPGEDRRHDRAAEGGLHLAHAALGVEVQVDRVAGQPEAEPRRDARREVAAARARRDEDEARRAGADRVGERGGVRVGRVGDERRALGDQHAVGAGGGERGGMLRAIAEHERLHGRAEARGQLRGLGEQLGRDGLRAPRPHLGDHPHRRATRRAARRERRPVVAGRRERPQALPERARERLGRVAGQHLAAARARHVLDAGDPGGRAPGADVVGREPHLGGAEARDRLGRRRLPLGLGREALLGEVLGRGDHRRQRPGHRLEALVGLALGDQGARRRIELEPARPRHLRQVQHLRHLGTDLPRLGVGAGAAEEDEVGLLAREHGGQRARRRERVGAGEQRIEEMERAVGAERQALDEPVARAGRPHAECHHLAAVHGAQRHRRAERAEVEGAHLARHALADEPAGLGVEAQRAERRHPLDAHDDPHPPSLTRSCRG